MAISAQAQAQLDSLTPEQLEELKQELIRQNSQVKPEVDRSKIIKKGVVRGLQSFGEGAMLGFQGRPISEHSAFQPKAEDKYSELLKMETLKNQVDPSRIKAKQDLEHPELKISEERRKKELDQEFKDPSGAQETQALYANRLVQSDNILKNFDNEEIDMGLGVSVQQGLPNIMNFAKSADFQSMEQAQRNFLNAVLRKESGAVISPSEFEEGRKQYFRQPGDSPEVVKQKAQNRALVVNSFIQGSGKAYIPNNLSTPSAPSGQITPEQAIAELKRRGKM